MFVELFIGQQFYLRMQRWNSLISYLEWKLKQLPIRHAACHMLIDYNFHHAYVNTLEYIKMFEKLNIFQNIHVDKFFEALPGILTVCSK